MKEGSKLYSIFKNKCPRCQKGDFWKKSNPYSSAVLRKDGMHETCSCCNLKYEKETGFWYGAMYVSYAFSVAIFVAVWIATYVLSSGNAGAAIYIVGIIGVALALFPLNYYLSRLIWINLFVRFDPDKQKCVQA